MDGWMREKQNWSRGDELGGEKNDGRMNNRRLLFYGPSLSLSLSLSLFFTTIELLLNHYLIYFLKNHNIVVVGIGSCGNGR